MIPSSMNAFVDALANVKTLNETLNSLNINVETLKLKKNQSLSLTISFFFNQ